VNNYGFSAKIQSIIQTGVMTVLFNQPIATPDNFTSINDTILQLSIIPGVESDPDLLHFTWNITGWQSPYVYF
jgi:hypothetical protein